MTLLGADARRRHRHRRRDRRAGEHLPLHRGEALHAVRRGDRGHARGGAAGDGDHAVAGRDLPAGGVHDRLRAPLHLSVRLDDGVRDPGLDDRQLHADADAQLALPEDRRRRRRRARPRTSGLFHAVDRGYAASLRWTLAHPMAIIGISAAAGRADLSAEPDGRAHVRAQRGHGRIHGPRRHAAGHLARGHDRDRAEASSRRSASRRACRTSPTWPAPTGTRTSTSSSICCPSTSGPSPRSR